MYQTKSSNKLTTISDIGCEKSLYIKSKSVYRQNLFMISTIYRMPRYRTFVSAPLLSTV